MKRVRTGRGQTRTARAILELPAARPLVRAIDHGPAVRLEAAKLGISGDRWVEPFLEANRAHLARLAVVPTIETRNGIALLLTPGSRIGAVPLLSPANRRVAAGLLVTPRFRWTALGAVLGDIGFATEPSIGGSPLVPGSAREVPTWLLAAPVVRRIEGMLAHVRRGFVERSETRQSPRGRIDWTQWASRQIPSGQWSMLHCRFPDPDDDPQLLAAVRWTLGRLDDELELYGTMHAARLLRTRIGELQIRIGPGGERRPIAGEMPGASEWVSDAVEAMGWVAEERGLGGSRVLDGMSWDMAIDEVWEAWVESFMVALAPRCGLTVLRRGRTGRSLNWRTSVGSMRTLIPDSGMRGAGRIVWVDAKYKRHLQLLARKGWAGLGAEAREAHRADLHQALAYASLEDVGRIDSILVYPELSPDDRNEPAVATLGAGQRRVRLLLVGLPFGFRSEDHRDRTLADWRELLSA